MTAELAIQLYTEMLKTGLLVCAPMLGFTLLVSVFVSIVQAATQIQDQTVAFIPKLGAFVLATLLLSPWILTKLVAFAQAMFQQASALR